MSTPEVCNGNPKESKIKWIKPKEVKMRRVKEKSEEDRCSKEKFLPLKLLVPDENDSKLQVLLHHYDKNLCSYSTRARAVDDDNTAHLNKQKVPPVVEEGKEEKKKGVMTKVMKRVQGTGNKIYSMFCLDCARVEEHATMMIHRQGFINCFKTLNM